MLDDYPIDDDYVDVENEQAPSRQARDAFDPDYEEDDSHFYDYGRGNGSRDQLQDVIDETAVVANDGRSLTRTMFYPWEADDKSWYSKLAKINDGMWDSSRSGKNKKADNDRWIDGFCSVLDSSEYVQSRVEHIIESINLRHMATYSAQQTILATIQLVERQERMNRGGKPLENSEAFHDLLDAVESDMEEMAKIRRLVKEKSPEYEYAGE